jgi:hypothetical protein
MLTNYVPETMMLILLAVFSSVEMEKPIRLCRNIGCYDSELNDIVSTTAFMQERI